MERGASSGTPEIEQFRLPSGNKSVRLWSGRLGFDSKSGYTNDCTIDLLLVFTASLLEAQH